MSERIRDYDHWEALQDDISNDHETRKKATGKIYPPNKLKRRTEARKAHIMREERKGKGRW